MHAIHGLLWEHWQQSRYWILGSGLFLTLMTFGVWLNHDWLMDEFRNDPFELDMLAWVVGFTAIGLLFVNQRMREVSLLFPRRQFALPCGTLPLVASHLLFKSAIAVALGGIIAIYHCVLFEHVRPSPLPVLLFLALAAMVQAHVMLAAICGAWPAVVAGGASTGAALFFYMYLDDTRRLDGSAAAALTALTLIAAGWAASLALAPAARQGRALALGGGTGPGGRAASIGVWMPQPLRLHWDFASPLWAQCWYEWRRILVWLPRAMAPAAVLGGFVWAADGNSEFALAVILAAAIAAGSACGYFLLRLPASEARFTLARPDADRILVDAKLLAALLAAVWTAAVTGAILVLGILVAVFYGESRAAGVAINYLPWILLAEIAILWVAATSAPVYLAGLMLWAAIGVLVVAPVFALGSISLLLGLLYAVVAAALIGVGLRRLHREGFPIPWELGLVAFSLLPEFLIYINYPLPLVEDLYADSRIGFLAPLFLLLGGLFFARRLDLISDRRLRRTFAGYLLVSLCFVTVMVANGNAVPLRQADTVFWWVAACFAPVVWVPLAVRVQRYR